MGKMLKINGNQPIAETKRGAELEALREELAELRATVAALVDKSEN